MLKRVEVAGFIELQEGVELPAVGDIVTTTELKLEVTGEHKDKQKRRGDVIELVHTRKTTLLEGSAILRVDAPAEPLFDGEEGGED
jgi:hypothetical protein